MLKTPRRKLLLKICYPLYSIKICQPIFAIYKMCKIYFINQSKSNPTTSLLSDSVACAHRTQCTNIDKASRNPTRIKGIMHQIYRSYKYILTSNNIDCGFPHQKIRRIIFCNAKLPLILIHGCAAQQPQYSDHDYRFL